MNVKTVGYWVAGAALAYVVYRAMFAGKTTEGLRDATGTDGRVYDYQARVVFDPASGAYTNMDTGRVIFGNANLLNTNSAR